METSIDLDTLAKQYLTAWTSADVDAILVLHAPDSQFQVHDGREVVTGADALREAFAEVFVRYPHFGADVRRLMFGDRHWVLDWTLTFRPEGGEERGFHCLDVVEVDDHGLVSRKDTFVNHAEARAALGVSA